MTLSIAHSTGQSKVTLLRRQRRQPGGSVSAAYGAGGSVSGAGPAENALQTESSSNLQTEVSIDIISET